MLSILERIKAAVAAKLAAARALIAAYTTPVIPDPAPEPAPVDPAPVDPAPEVTP